MAIVAPVLESALNGATKTEIMRNVNLNYLRANRYCAMLVKSGLLSYDSGTKTYGMTAKGRCLLYACDELFQHLQPVNEIIGK